MNIQATYRQNIFSSVEEMDNAVQAHIYHNAINLSDNYKKILRLLASYSLKTLGTAHLKYDTIAEQVGCSKSTIVRAMKRLKELGIIKVTKGSKRNGIQGADYFHILNFSKQVTMQTRTHEMTTRATHEIPCGSKAQDTKNHTESFNSFKTNFNPFVNSYITYSACENARVERIELKDQLRHLYLNQTKFPIERFEEICSAAFNRLKQGMERGVPYEQMKEMVIRCMRQLINKNPNSVGNPVALYSGMIRKQTNQLFEAHIKPVQAFNKPREEKIPDWFYSRNEVPTSVNNEGVDFEAERQKVLAKLGQGAC